MSKITYKITQQYAKEDEKPLAEFSELNDANFFIERKILSDAEKYITLIYRLFKDYKLIKEFNIEKVNVSIRFAQYATGDKDLPPAIGPFKVSKDKTATQIIASFADLNNAELFVEDKLTQSNNENSSKETYYLFNNKTLITQMDQHVKKQFLEEESKGKGQSSSFRPTPLNTTPRPSGSPHSWIKKDDEKEDEK